MTNEIATSNSKYFTQKEILAIAKGLYPTKFVNVTRFYLKPFSKKRLGYLGDHHLLTIEVCNSEDQLDKEKVTFFVKTSLPDGNESQDSLFRREPKFFREVVAHMLTIYEDEPWAPAFHLAKENAIVMENLQIKKFTTKESKLDLKNLKTMMRTLARFHASSLLLEKKLGTPLCDVYPEFSQEIQFADDDIMAQRWLMAGMEAAEAVAEKLNLDWVCIKRGYELAIEAMKHVSGETNVFCHNDLWCNNVMFDERGEKCRLVDFQLMSYKSYAIDLLQALHLNMVNEERKELEEELIETYHDALNDCLKNHDCREPIRLDDILQTVEQKRICGLVAAVQILPITIGLNSKISAAKYLDNEETLQNFMYVSRRDFLLEALKKDKNFRGRIGDSVRELVKYMERLEASN